jgi:xanthine dehydrogenase iron-sulfur cluster and FAD-binding subunit A
MRARTAIREFMSGNLCRCAAYPNIVDAITQARDEGAIEPVGDYKRALCDAVWNTRQ